MCGVEAELWVLTVSVSHAYGCGHRPDWPCKPSGQAKLVTQDCDQVAGNNICQCLQVFTEADQAELQYVITQINKRVPLGGAVREDKLICELVRLNINEGLIRRALVFLARSQDYEHKRGRLHRHC